MIGRLTVFEYFQVERLRRAFYEPLGLPVQRRSPQARWWIAREGERVLGCYCVEDDRELRLRWGHDFFAVPGRSGWRALYAMAEHLYALAVADELEVRFVVHPANRTWLRIVERVGLEPVGIIVGGTPSLRSTMVPRR